MPKRRYTFILIITAVVSLFGSGIALAQTDTQTPPKTGLSISPPTFELSANPGDTLKNSLRVDNISGETLEVSVDKRNFTALGEEGGINLSAEESKYALASWMTVTPGKVTIPKGESRTFNYQIAVPSFAEPGGRFGSIVFKTTAKPVNGQSGVAIAQEVGALVFVKIAGKVQEKAAVASFGPASGFNEFGPVDFNLRLRNEGNVQFKPRGTVTITNFLGQKVATVPIEGQNVLPDATRKMTAQWKDTWLFGRYTATASIVYGNNNQILTATTTFWGFPLRPALAVLVVLAILFILVYPRRQRIGRALKVLSGKE